MIGLTITGADNDTDRHGAHAVVVRTRKAGDK